MELKWSIDREEKRQAIQYAKREISITSLACICPKIRDFLKYQKGYDVKRSDLAPIFPTLSEASPVRGPSSQRLLYPFFPRNKEGQQKRLQLLERIEQNDL